MDGIVLEGAAPLISKYVDQPVVIISGIAFAIWQILKLNKRPEPPSSPKFLPFEEMFGVKSEDLFSPMIEIALEPEGVTPREKLNDDF